MPSQALFVFAFSVVLLLSQVTVSTATDNKIHMSINGTEVTLPATDCTHPPICTVNIANNAYTVGGVTVTITKLTTGLTDARIQSDDSTDQLLMRNVKITTNTSTMVTIQFWREFPPVGAPGTITTWYYEGHGGGKILKNNNWGAPNAKIVFRGYVEKNVGLPSASNVSLGSLSLPASCPTNQPQLKFCVPPGTPTSSQATFSWSNGYFRTTSQINLDRGVDRILTGYIELTLPIPANGDSLQMAETTTAGLQIQGNSSPGQGNDACDTCTGEQCATCINCPCKPKAQVNSFCMTSFSSSTGPTSSTECPNCITADGQVTQSAKVPLFAKSNWDNLLEDMARGQGEHLASLASLLGVPREQHPAFFVVAQEEYSSLSLHDKVPAPEVMIAGLRERWATQSGLISLAVRPAN
jgi:hypothetical protein